MTRGISSPSSLLREQSFLCAAGETSKWSWVQILKSARGGALRCFWIWVEHAYTDRGAYVLSSSSSPHPPSSHQCVTCNDLFKTKPIPPTPIQGLSKHCLPLWQVIWGRQR
uniref:Uncharacterized protein n=2 Tax=Canis lupus familiaris TaxID=9615 RepID=A0A8C0MZ45_CANLF